MTFKLFSRVTEAFEELCIGTASPSNSLPVVLSEDFTKSGAVADNDTTAIAAADILALNIWYA
jgi:hypothetical protein